jgi:histidine ammonia-lyase
MGPVVALDHVELTGQPLSTAEVEAVARGRVAVSVSASARASLERSRERLLSAVGDQQPHYGINTGFGALGRVRIDDESLAQLQTNLIRSHATGVGAALADDIVRATMLVLAASLCRGYSGVRFAVVDQLRAMLNAGLIPEVPEIGSVGASGDLAPLAHIALVIIGEGRATLRGRVLSGDQALRECGLRPLALEAKEGIALINGTHLMAGRGALLVQDFDRLFEAALLAAAMSVDTCRATDATLDPRVHQLRRQAGQIYVAGRLRDMLGGSEIVKSHVANDPRVQDPYSFRCCPAVLGAAWDAFLFVRAKLEDELAAVTDNPLVFEEQGRGQIVSGGNFHGAPLALPLDLLAIALAQVAGIAERRVFHMLSGADPEAELPTFLTPQAGLQSGLMIAQYTAAACCNELVGLANPASVVNLSTSAGMEDYNAFGPRSAAKAARAIQLARSVVAIELLCAATGLDHHRPLRSGELVERAYQIVRRRVLPLEQDRPLAPDIRAIEELIDSGAFAHP